MSGTISTTLTAAYYLVVSPTTITATGAVIADSLISAAVNGGSDFTLINDGQIINTRNGGDALDLGAGSSLTNAASGTIETTSLTGITLDGVGESITNSGSIRGGFEGIRLNAGGSILNQADGSITCGGGAARDVLGLGDPITVTNAGRIYGYGALASGIAAYSGGSITNLAGGTIGGNGPSVILGDGGAIDNMAGGLIVHSVVIGGGSTTIVNAGTIAGEIDFLTVPPNINSFYQYGFSPTAAGTVVNSGTISASGDAISFFSGFANRVVLDPGSVIVGVVDGANTIGSSIVSTLELASNGFAGSLTGLGTQFINFARIVVDPGAPWTLSGTNTIAAGVTLTAATVLADSGTLTVGGTIDGELQLIGGPSVTVQASGLIGGGQQGIFTGYSTPPVTITNAGRIAGAGGTEAYGVVLRGGGTVTNQSGGTISGYRGIFGEFNNSPAVTVVNAGSIAGAGAGIELGGGGSVTNQSGGIISGHDGIRDVLNTPAVTVVNAGTITGGTTSWLAAGVYISNGGSVTNQAGGMITGYDAFVGSLFGRTGQTVVNAGGILGNLNSVLGKGVYLGFGGTVTNQAGGTISGDTAIAGVNAALTVVNAGIVAGYSAQGASPVISNGAGVRLSLGGSVTNQSGGTITGSSGIDSLGTGATVVNAGLIAGAASSRSSTGVNLAAGGSLQNTGTISGYTGVFGSNAAVTIVNAGTIAGNATGTLGRGIDFLSGGSVTNLSTGTISGYTGIYGDQSLTVLNAGAIFGFGEPHIYDGFIIPSGGSAGITLNSGGTIINQLGGTIDGYSGIVASGAATVVNDGTIYGAAARISQGKGVDLEDGGSVTNQSLGSISGRIGISVENAPATVANASVITSTTAPASISAPAASSATQQRSMASMRRSVWRVAAW